MAKHEMDRRQFLKSAGMAGGVLIGAAVPEWARGIVHTAEGAPAHEPEYYDSIVYTSTNPFTGELSPRAPKHLPQLYKKGVVRIQRLQNDEQHEIYTPIGLKNSGFEQPTAIPPSPSPSPTATATATQEIPTPTPTKEPEPGVEVPVPPESRWSRESHTYSTHRSAGTITHEDQPKGTVLKRYPDGSVLIEFDNGKSKETRVGDPAQIPDLVSSSMEISKEGPQGVDRTLIPRGTSMRLDAPKGDWGGLVIPPNSHLRVGDNPLTYSFNIEVVNIAGAKHAVAYGPVEENYFPNSDIQTAHSPRVAVVNGKLVFQEAGFDAQSGGFFTRTYPLDVLQSTHFEGKVDFPAPDQAVVYQKQGDKYVKIKSIKLQYPLNALSEWIYFSAFADKCSLLLRDASVQTPSDIKNVSELTLAPEFSEEGLGTYLPRDRVGITDLQIYGSFSNIVNPEIAGSFGAIDLSNAGVEGRNVGDLQFLLAASSEIRQFPYDTTLRAELLGQRWNPTISAQIETILPEIWLTKEKRAEYINAWLDYADEHGNTEPLLVGGLFNGKGRVISQWVSINARRGEQLTLVSDIAELAGRRGRGTILQLPRDFRLSVTNAGNLLAFLKDVHPPIKGLSIYPLGSTRSELEQFFISASEILPDLQIDYYGLAKRPKNKVSVEDALEIILPAGNGGTFYFDSWIRGGGITGNFNVDPDAEFLIHLVHDRTPGQPDLYLLSPSSWYLNTVLPWARSYAASH